MMIGQLQSININKKRTVCQLRPHTPNHHAAFLAHLANVSWDDIISISDTQVAFERFYDEVSSMLHSFYPLHTVTLTNIDRYLVTPNIKNAISSCAIQSRRGKVVN